MRTVEEHLDAVLALAKPLPAVRVPVGADPDAVLAEAVIARLPVPPFDNSAMDGFAVRADDVAAAPCVVDVAGDIPAGTAASTPLAPGQAMRIMTGAPMPAGADAVVPVEDTDQPPGDSPLPRRVEVRTAPVPGRHIRRRGEDVGVGDVVLSEGARATSAAAAAAASVGLGEWLVTTRPRVLVVATGSELVAPGEPLGPGQIPDSNSLLLAGLVRQFGGRVADVVRVGDATEDFLQALAGADADLIVTTGGVSAGAFEVVRQATAGDVEFVKVAMQPGKPQGVGHWEVRGAKVPLLALPGNPVSVFVSAWLFVRPLIARLAGRPVGLPTRRANVVEGWTTPPNRRQYVPVTTTPDGIRPAHRLGSGSHAVASLHLADALAVVPEDVGQIRPGDVLEVFDTNA
ncbi:molybdopterin molybdotransferase MoeA [Tessaracoccus sp. OS52]|uniref:molybdopterin molybdotransferase MoeA n=1 Tax=Tessaracoccus sp. OS52 TaxID=2886691 RepID=UPI001D12B019|nr:gephyrin-like molybdotransferase Glp [Tessaracoccus sp. OS52]MCC2593710.1 molybdopterin molybdotransferase MoeA [Tessaracoccus sp. OS52]